MQIVPESRDVEGECAVRTEEKCRTCSVGLSENPAGIACWRGYRPGPSPVRPAPPLISGTTCRAGPLSGSGHRAGSCAHRRAQDVRLSLGPPKSLRGPRLRRRRCSRSTSRPGCSARSHRREHGTTLVARRRHRPSQRKCKNPPMARRCFRIGPADACHSSSASTDFASDTFRTILKERWFQDTAGEEESDPQAAERLRRFLLR